jgi:hydrogenase 3 maturation protease
VAVLAIGSTLRGDDAAGILAAEELNRLLSKPFRRPTIEVFMAETAPENLTGQIKEFRPTCLIMLDAVDTASEPGSIRLIDLAEVDPGAGMSTHSPSIKMLTDYLKHFLTCDVLIVGIQPQTLEFGRPPSKPVLKAAKAIADAIADAATQP